jgi:hypothetical protein
MYQESFSSCFWNFTVGATVCNIESALSLYRLSALQAIYVWYWEIRIAPNCSSI